MRRRIAANRAIRRVTIYQRTGTPKLLAEAVMRFQAIADATPAEHPDRARHLNNLGLALRLLFERTGDPDTLAAAVRAGREAVAALPPGHGDLATMRNNLGVSLRILFDRTGDEAALAEAVAASRAAVTGSPANSPEVAQHQSNLGFALLRAAEHTDDMVLLTEALQASRDAAAAAPDGAPYTGAILTNLTAALQRMFSRTGDPTLLAEATATARAAVAATPKGSPDRAKALGNLASALTTGFTLTGDSTLLTEAIEALRSTDDAVSGDEPDAPVLLNFAEEALLQIFDRTGHTDMATAAVQAGRESVARLPAGHPSRARYLSNLSQAMLVLGEHTADSELLAESARVARDALAEAAPGDPGRPMMADNLGLALQAGYEASADPSALEQAVQAGREAVAASPAGDPFRANFLCNLGLALRLVAGHSAGPDHVTALAEAARCYAEAARDASAQAMTRIAACGQLTGLPEPAGVRPDDALAAAETAVALLPQVTSRALIRTDREFRLAGLSWLAGQVAAAAVAAGRPERAVELLEQARGVLVAETIDTRNSDMGRLRDAQPALAEELGRLRTRLDVLGSEIPTARTADDTARAGRERRQASSDWESLLARIRSVDGFDDFLRPPGIDRLSAYASSGPVVMAYTSPSRCDALVLTSDRRVPVRLVPLPHLTEASAESQVSRLEAAVRAGSDPNTDLRSRQAAQYEINAVLEWEWDTIAGPILEALGHTDRPGHGESWPRLWWCPVGTLASLPLHAAGYHGDSRPGTAAPRAVIDLVVSSYTITLRALGDARNHGQVRASGSMLIVPAPQVPGAAPLPGIVGEAQALARLVPGARTLDDPVRDTVLAALPDYPVAHFACHGRRDLGNPAASHLVLLDHEATPLTIADISSLRLTAALAYLSACDTALTAPALADEAVHLLGAFQLAGYQQVIGTLWPVSDTAAQRLATDFYGHITGQGTTAPAPRDAAQALHNATRQLRERYPGYPGLWAAYIHTGI